MGRHQRGRGGEPKTRPRYRRITAAGLAVLVTLVAVFGAVGFIPAASTPEAVSAEVASATSAPKQQAKSARPSPAGAVRLSGYVAASPPRHTQQTAPKSTAPTESASPTERVVSTGLPSRSGVGKRVVFDISDQRVWLVSAEDEVARTYLVSGSLTDNLAAGTYKVYSTSMDAVGVDDSGRMRYMVRFAHGTQAAIGFHDIPIHRGELVQTRDQLGTPQSHGCIRQLRRDAKALWDFAPTGTQVVVLE